MDYLSAVLLGAALAADASAVSVSFGMKYRKNFKGTLKSAFAAAACFGLFQTIMPVLGWSIGKVGRGAFENIDHIIAFVILMILGVKMLFDARKDDEFSFRSFSFKELFALAVATSIDAMASGIVIPVSVGAVTPFDMFITVLIIGIITLILSFLCFIFGSLFRFLKPKYAEILGGLMLILIGMKTLMSG